MMPALTSLLTALPLLAPLPIYVEERAEIPWIVVTSPGRSCGAYLRADGPRGSTRDELIARLKATTTPTAARTAKALPLLSTPGLWGVEGEIIVAAAEALLRRAGVPGPVALYIDTSGAWLELPASLPTTAMPAGFTAAELKDLVALAQARVARRRATVGALAAEQAQRFSCHGVAEDPALPADLGRQLRVRFG